MRHFDAWLLRDPYSIFHYYPTGRRWQETVRDLIHDRKICAPPEDSPSTRGEIDLHRIHPQSDSLFLTRLPPEIRLLIYRYAFGDQVVHLVQLKDKIRHVRCHQTTSSLDRHRRCCPITAARWRSNSNSSSNANHHQHQHHLYPHTHPSLPDSLSHTPLTLLRTCRAVYCEAADLAYATLPFDVDDLHTFIAFSRAIAPRHLRALRHLTVQWSPVWPPLTGHDSKASIYAHTHNDRLWRRFWARVAACHGLCVLNLSLDLGRFHGALLQAGAGAGGGGGGGARLRLAVDEPWVKPVCAVRGLQRFELAVTARCDAAAKRLLEQDLVRDAVTLRDQLREILCSERREAQAQAQPEPDVVSALAEGRPRLAITAA
ncbi:hypothetical protein BDV59DRAFT_139128 [Aspergillus ambiguus]|uniref:uncharacterized protein n=1 Tax=Aspergillus ambiguus TaxID=176160 RepID=UPI003CCCC4D0